MSNNLIRIEEIALALDESESVLRGKIAEILGLDITKILDYSLVKKAIDSRNKRKIIFVYSVDVKIAEPEKYFTVWQNKEEFARHKVRLFAPYEYRANKPTPILRWPSEGTKRRLLIVGSGPSGLFAGLVLARAHMRPVIIERGKDVDARVQDVDRFFLQGKLDTNSNVQFGEGGAGTFSDGKLNTLVNNPRTKFIFEEFVKAGAPKEILWDAKPHIGTDKLREVVKNMRQEIIRLGGEVRFETCLTDLEIEDDKIISAVLNNVEKVLVDDLIIAIGHSARDTYEMLYRRKLNMIAKPFAIGVRIEHKAEMINRSQYGAFYNHQKLGAARYNLVAHLPDSRSVYTFCMCPGGYVVAAGSEEGMVVTNGMSEYAQDNTNSNSALLVGVTPADFGSDHPLAGVEFQRQWERNAFVAGGKNYRAPAQYVGDFLQDKISNKIKDVEPTYRPGVTFAALRDCLPDYVITSLKEALPLMDNKIKGFAHAEALLTGVETRSSSPLRILRDETCQSNIRGIYPTGEGAGYAGGIVSSAIDGLLVAEKILEKYANEFSSSDGHRRREKLF